MTALSAICPVANVPLILPAVRLVKFAPLVAGSVAGNQPFGIVPDPRLSAFNEVRLAPLPTNDVAVMIPETSAPILVNVSPIPGTLNLSLIHI